MSTGSSIVTTTESFTSQSKPIAVEVLKPASPPKLPAIVIAHGSDGLTSPWDKQIRAFGAFMASKGFVALIPHYFDSTGTAPATSLEPATLMTNREIWTKTIDDALVFANGRPDVQAGKLGSIGFSLGGHLVLRQAMMGTGWQGVKAVVEFFAPIAAGGFSVLTGAAGGIAALPPLQIHHGGADRLVSIQQSEDFVEALEAAGKRSGTDYEFYPYPGEGHGFTVAKDVQDSMDRSLSFMLAHVK